MEMSFSGTISRIFDTVTFKSGAKKREFWASETIPPFSKTGKPYENKMAFEIFTGQKAQSDHTTALDNIPVGSIIKFSFSPRGNEWQGHDKVFNALRVTSDITVVRSGPAQHNGARTPSPATPPNSLNAADDPNEMPF